MKTIVKLFGIVVLAAAIGFFVTACSANTPEPTVTDVTVTSETTNVERGETLDFTAIVHGNNRPPQTVDWSVEGNQSGETYISTEGRLTVSSNEQAVTLTVRATSTFNTSVSGIATVTVAAKIPDVMTPTDINATFGQSLSQVALPSGWAWDNPTAQVGAVGQRTHSATYTRVGNYLPVTRTITVTVERATPHYTIPEGLTATFGQTLNDVELPANWTWNNPAALVGDVGQQTHNATFNVGETENFTALTVTHPVTITVVDLPPLAGTVTITGTAQVGQTLTANTTALDGTGDISYQWLRGGTEIEGATTGTYTLVATDIGTLVSVRVRRAGNSGSITSAATTPVLDLERGEFTFTFADFRDGAPELTGPTLRIVGGQTETVIVGDPELYSSIRWFFNNAEISSAKVSGTNGSVLTLGADFFGGINGLGEHTVTVQVVRSSRTYSGFVTFTVKP